MKYSMWHVLSTKSAEGTTQFCVGLVMVVLVARLHAIDNSDDDTRWMRRGVRISIEISYNEYINYRFCTHATRSLTVSLIIMLRNLFWPFDFSGWNVGRVIKLLLVWKCLAAGSVERRRCFDAWYFHYFKTTRTYWHRKYKSELFCRSQKTH